MLETKANSENDDDNTEKISYLQLMANNVEPLLRSVAEKKQLTDFLVAAAPTVSRNFYNEMCEKYAVQLVEERNYMKASMYLLFCGKLHSAVKVLLGKQKILEALALAKARLAGNDPLLHGVLAKAAHYFSVNHHTEHEAACYLAMKEPLLAAKTLYCSADSRSIYTSVYICKKFNLKEEAETYGYFCLEKCLAQNDWPTFYKVVDLIGSLKVYKVLGHIHELIFTQVKALKKEEGIIANKIFGVTGNKLQIWENKTFGDSNLSFLPYLYNAIKAENIIPEDRESLEEIHKALNAMILKRKKYEMSTEAHISVAIYISQIIVTSLLSDFSLVTKYFMKVFLTTYNIVFLPRVVCWLLLPFDIYWCSNEDTFLCENKYLGSEMLPFAEYFQNIYISVCNKFAPVGRSDFGDFIISQDILSNLNGTVQQVLAVISKKTTEDSLLLYFSICYLNELRKLAKNGWKFRCYNSVIPSKGNVEETVHEDGSLLTKCDKSRAKKDVMFINDVPKENEAYQVELQENCAENKSQNITSVTDSVKDVLGIFPPELDIYTKNKIARHHGWADFSEFANKVMNNASQDATDNVPVQTSIPSFVEEECSSIPLRPVGTSKNIDCGIAKNKTRTLSENVTCEIRENEISITDNVNGKIRENESSENIDSKIENEASPERMDSKVVENRENETLSENICGKVEGNKIPSSENIGGKVEGKEISSSENINGKVEGNQISSLENIDAELEEKEISSGELFEDHAQCWTDISLYYVLTKCFISVMCKDEYALLYYLQKFLYYLDNTIADLARQQSVKSALNNYSNQVPSATNNNSSDQRNIAKDLTQSNDNLQESSAVPDSLKCEDIIDSVEENNSSIENAVDSAKLENEVKTKIDENQVTLKDEISINYTDGKDKLSDKISIKTYEEENEDNNTVPSMEIGKTEFTSRNITSEKLQTQHEKISEQIKLLNSKEFCYPNPFDAVSAINGICCDIFHKNPCKLIQEKFHELAHEVNKWNAKFCTGDSTLKCDICQETINA